jgi:hypothetical protein
MAPLSARAGGCKAGVGPSGGVRGALESNEAIKWADGRLPIAGLSIN